MQQINYCVDICAAGNSRVRKFSSPPEVCSIVFMKTPGPRCELAPPSTPAGDRVAPQPLPELRPRHGAGGPWGRRAPELGSSAVGAAR